MTKEEFTTTVRAFFPNIHFVQVNHHKPYNIFDETATVTHCCFVDSHGFKTALEYHTTYVPNRQSFISYGICDVDDDELPMLLKMLNNEKHKDAYADASDGHWDYRNRM